MAKQKRDFSLIIWVFGWLLEVAIRLRNLIQESDIPFEAFERLGSKEGEATLRRVIQLIHVDHLSSLESNARTELPKLNQNPATSGFVDVPDLSARELVELAERELGVGVPCEQLRQQGFYREEGSESESRGKRYEFRWVPVVTQDDMVGFSELVGQGWKGHTGAFLAWLIKEKPSGNYAYDFLVYDGRSGRCSFEALSRTGCVAFPSAQFLCREVPKT